MEFPGRGNAPLTQQNPTSTTAPVGSKKNKSSYGLMRWGTLGLGGVVILLIIAVILAIAFSAPKSQSGYVDSNKLQAVFLNTGQVYFGNIKEINPQFLVLTNIFYLQTNNSSSSSSSSSSNSNTNVSLVKLGCELHAPYDQMVINMQQVTFWENLQSTGQVAKAVAQYQKEYPHGQTCSDQSSSSGSTTNSVQNAPAK